MWGSPGSLSSHPPKVREADSRHTLLHLQGFCHFMKWTRDHVECALWEGISKKKQEKMPAQPLLPPVDCFVAPLSQTAWGGLFFITRECESFPDLCDWDSKALLYPMVLLNPSVCVAFQTVGESSVTARALVLVTAQRCWQEQ